MAVINRVLRLRPGEAGVVTTMGLVLIVNFLAQQISEITAISNFLSDVGGDWILVVWLVDSVLILVSMGLQSLIIDRFNRVTLMRGLLLIFGLVFLALRLLFALGAPNWLGFGLWYLVATQQLVFFPVIFWILANDMFDLAQATRLFPLITSLGFVGRLMGIGISLVAPSWMAHYAFFQPPGLLLFSAGFYFLMLLVFGLATRHIRLRATCKAHETMRDSLSEGFNFVRDVPAFRYLAISTCLLLACDVVIEFRFLLVSAQSFNDPARYQTFYASYRLGLTMLSILIQALFTSRIISSLTVKNTFLVKPAATFVGSLLMLLQAGLAGAVGGVMLMRLSQYTIDEPTRKAFQSLVPEERRGRVSIFMESYLYFVGTVLGCLVTGAVVLVGHRWPGQTAYRVYTGLCALAALASIAAIYQMRRVYDESLLNWRLKRRQRGRSVLDNINF